MNHSLRSLAVAMILGAALSAQAKPIQEPKDPDQHRILPAVSAPVRIRDPHGVLHHRRSELRPARVGHDPVLAGRGQYLADREPARLPTYAWDNIHGSVVCGPNQHNLESDHVYALRAILHFSFEDDVPRRTTSNVVTARVASYLCNEKDDDADGIPDDLELALARKYFPDAWGVDKAADLKTFYGYAGDPFAMRHGTIPFVVRPLASSNGRCPEDRQCLEILYRNALQLGLRLGVGEGLVLGVRRPRGR